MKPTERAFYKYLREKENLNKEKENLEHEKKSFLIEKKEQELKNKEVLMQLEFQKKEQKILEIEHRVEKERLRLTTDQQTFKIVELQAKYDATVMFFEQKIEINHLITENKSLLKQQTIHQLEFINKREKLISQQEKNILQNTLIKEQNKQILTSAQKEKEVTGIIHNHTNNLNRVHRQIQELQSDRNYYKNENQFLHNDQNRIARLEQMIRHYTKIKEERLSLMEENLISREQMFNENSYYQQRYSNTRDTAYNHLNY